MWLRAKNCLRPKTARRSLNLLLAEWANRGLNQWTIQQKTVAMVFRYNILQC